jgi:hypothetical protein
MTLTLSLPLELEQRLVEGARRQGVAVDQYTLQILAQHLPANEQGKGAATLLQSWIDEDDAGEQKETGDYLVHALDEDRLADRKLFPPEMKGVSW